MARTVAGARSAMNEYETPVLNVALVFDLVQVQSHCLAANQHEYIGQACPGNACGYFIQCLARQAATFKHPC